MTDPAGALLGAPLSALNPKNLFMEIGSGAAIGSNELSAAAASLTIAIYVVIASFTVAIPVLSYLIASQLVTAPLEMVKSWLLDNDMTVMIVRLVILSVVQLGKGISNI